MPDERGVGIGVRQLQRTGRTVGGERCAPGYFQVVRRALWQYDGTVLVDQLVRAPVGLVDNGDLQVEHGGAALWRGHHELSGIGSVHQAVVPFRVAEGEHVRVHPIGVCRASPRVEGRPVELWRGHIILVAGGNGPDIEFRAFLNAQRAGGYPVTVRTYPVLCPDGPGRAVHDLGVPGPYPLQVHAADLGLAEHLVEDLELVHLSVDLVRNAARIGIAGQLRGRPVIVKPGGRKPGTQVPVALQRYGTAEFLPRDQFTVGIELRGLAVVRCRKVYPSVQGRISRIKVHRAVVRNKGPLVHRIVKPEKERAHIVMAEQAHVGQFIGPGGNDPAGRIPVCPCHYGNLIVKGP